MPSTEEVFTRLQIVLSGGSLSFKLTEEAYQRFLIDLKIDETGWITIITVDHEMSWVRREHVIAFKAAKNREQKSLRRGVTIKEICQVTGVPYPTQVRKINKPHGIILETASDRRILTTDENFDRLHLTQEQRNKLKEIEAKRLST